MRAFLTMLGIIIGVAAVILVVSAGAGAQSLIIGQIQAQGSNLISVMPGGTEEEGPPVAVMGIVITTLTYDDAKAILGSAQAPHVVAVAPIVQGIGTMTYGSNKFDGNFVGTSYQFLDVEQYDLADGQWFTENDEKSLAQVVVLGSKVKQELFGNEDAVGENIKIKRKNFEVIGVMEERGVSGFMNYDNYAYMPVTTAQKNLLGINHISLLRAKVDEERYIDQTVEDIEYILRDRHNITNPSEDDFTVRSLKEALEVVEGVTNAIRLFLTAIAGIALLVGGIGIMNTMLVAVKSRIHEIGIRKAMGAKNRDIMLQFLFESIFFTLFGGIIGIITGTLLSIIVAFVVRYFGYDWAFLISPAAVFIATLVSIIIGLTFGIYPARKAAKLDPIAALRYE